MAQEMDKILADFAWDIALIKNKADSEELSKEDYHKLIDLELKATGQAIESLLERRVLEGRIEELGLLTRENFDGNADYKKWSKAVLAYMRTRLAMLVSLRGGEKE